MPSSAGYDYIFGSIHHASTAQLASSQLASYLSDLHISNGTTLSINHSAILPLRKTAAARPYLHKSVSAPGGLLLTHSILSSRKSNGPSAYERKDSLEDSLSPEVDIVHQSYRPWSKKPRSTAKSGPILKHYEQFNGQSKKRVRFADDVGLDLERTRFFMDELDGWEPEPLPVAECKGKSTDTADSDDDDLVVTISEWQVNFSQPAADYLGFREKLEANSVGLENVIIKEKTKSFMGTIKVLNKSFQKDVFVRCTFNNWETFSDYPAKFCGKGAEAVAKYDTFSFEISIPTHADDKQTIQFCIGFRTDGCTYWDSNSGRNYQLITTQAKQRKSTEKESDAYALQNLAGSWSQFASWNHLNTTQPYY